MVALAEERENFFISLFVFPRGFLSLGLFISSGELFLLLPECHTTRVLFRIGFA